MTMTTTTQQQRPRDDVYARLEERIIARDQIGTSQIFYDLVREGRSSQELAREATRIFAPYTHVPFHQRNDSGDIRFVNNDHCLLSMRATFMLQNLVPAEAKHLPMAQTFWYIPSALDPWNQLLGKAPGHYNRSPDQANLDVLQPVVHWPDGEPLVDSTSSLQEKLDHWLTLIMRYQVNEAYRYFLGIIESHPNEREQIMAQLAFAGLINVQDKSVSRVSFVTGHRAYRARATIEVADAVGWESAHDVLYAGVLDQGVGPHWYSQYEMACTYCRLALQGQDIEFAKTNATSLTPEQVKQTVNTIMDGDEMAVARHMGEMLKEGISIGSLIDAIQLAAAESILQCGSPMAYNMPMHVFEYCNTVRWFFDRFEHPHKAKLVFVAAIFVNEVFLNIRSWPGNGPRPIKAPQAAAAWSQGKLLQKIDESIIALQPDDAVGLTHAYLEQQYDTRPLVSTLAFAASKMGNDPHNQEISLCLLEDFGRNSHAARGRLLLASAGHAAGHRKYGDPLEAYRRFAEAFGIESRQDAKGDAPIEESFDDD